MKLGVLYSRSQEHPELLPDFIDGLKSSLKFQQLTGNVELLTESIGFGGSEKEVHEKTEKLLVLDKADVLVAYIDLRVLALIEPLIYSKGKLLIVVNAGANYPENRVPQENIIFLSLRHSFLCWLTGRLAGENNEVPAAVATSFYDAGYLHIAAITLAFMGRGGAISFNYVNKDKYDDSFEIAPLTEFLSSEKQTKQILSVFDSAPAAFFYDRLNQLEESSGLDVFVSPMMLEESALKNKSHKFSIVGYLPYDANANNDANNGFRSYYEEENKRPVTFFALQGWETGLLINEISKETGQITDGGALRNSLLGKKINSPRGELTLDEDSNYFTAPVFHATIKSNLDRMEIKQEDAANEWKEFLSNPVEGLSSGWTNTYLCY